MKVFPYMKPLCKEWERWLFSNAWIIAQSFKAHKETGEKKKGPIEGTNNSPETSPIEMEICELMNKKN